MLQVSADATRRSVSFATAPMCETLDKASRLPKIDALLVLYFRNGTLMVTAEKTTTF
jgi:hypothetical protein